MRPPHICIGTDKNAVGHPRQIADVAYKRLPAASAKQIEFNIGNIKALHLDVAPTEFFRVSLQQLG